MHEKSGFDVKWTQWSLKKFCIWISTDNLLQKDIWIIFLCWRKLKKRKCCVGYRNQYNTEKEIFFQLNNDMILFFFVGNSLRRVYQIFFLSISIPFYIQRYNITFHVIKQGTRLYVDVVCIKADNKGKYGTWGKNTSRGVKIKVQRPPLR